MKMRFGRSAARLAATRKRISRTRGTAFMGNSRQRVGLRCAWRASGVEALAPERHGTEAEFLCSSSNDSTESRPWQNFRLTRAYSSTVSSEERSDDILHRLRPMQHRGR